MVVISADASFSTNYVQGKRTVPTMSTIWDTNLGTRDMGFSPVWTSAAGRRNPWDRWM